MNENVSIQNYFDCNILLLNESYFYLKKNYYHLFSPTYEKNSSSYKKKLIISFSF